MESPLVSIVIPAKNEAPTVAEIVRQAKKYAQDVVIVDGNSSDDTKNIALKEGARVVQDEGTGKGRALRRGIEQARGDIIVFIDADGSHDPHDIPRLIAPVADGSYDMMIGSRTKGGSDELQGDLDKCLRLVGSAIINLIVNVRWKQQLTDIQNGLRAVRADAVRSLHLREDITTIEQEMVMKALKRGYRIGEVPTHEYKRQYGTSVIILKKVWFRYICNLLSNIL